jgi:hypothetical protein
VAVMKDDRGEGLLGLRTEEGFHDTSVDELSGTLVHPGLDPAYFVFLDLHCADRTSKFEYRVVEALLKTGVHAVLSTGLTVSDELRQRFTIAFYDALLRSGIVDIGVAQARKEIYHEEGWEWCSPVLYTRIAAPRVFDTLPDSILNAAQHVSSA